MILRLVTESAILAALGGVKRSRFRPKSHSSVRYKGSEYSKMPIFSFGNEIHTAALKGWMKSTLGLSKSAGRNRFLT
jgi:hypothetical protein